MHTAKEIKFGDILEKDILIAFMGPTGAGKSNIIDHLSNLPTKRARHGLDFFAQEISVIRIRDHPTYKNRLVLIDTPGLDNGEISDKEIESRLLAQLKQKNKKERETPLSGVIYLHRIKDNRATSMPDLRMLGCLCGGTTAKKLLLVSTMWDKAANDLSTSERLENELKLGAWKEAMELGAKIGRFHNTRTSAWNLIDSMLGETGVLSEEPPRCLTVKGDIASVCQIRPTDIVIAVMGMTGSGKSTFVSQFTSFGVKIGHSLESCTNDIAIVRVPSPPDLCYDLVFIDTPGFDHTHISDATVLQMISDWLNKSYAEGVRLAGILYLHRISDSPVMTKAPLKNLLMFQDLCGRRSFTSVVLVTTMWDEVDNITGDNRERELKDSFWATLLAGGSRAARFDGTYDSAATILDPLIKFALERNATFLQGALSNPENRQALLLQEEMNVKKFKLWETSAGRQLCPKLDLIEAKQKSLKQKMAELKSTQPKDHALQSLESELKALNQELKVAAREMRHTKFSLRYWLRGGFGIHGLFRT